MEDKFSLIIDTSALNRLADELDARDSEALFAGLTSEFHILLTFTNILEIVANRCSERRRQLLAVCRRLLTSGECIDQQRRTMQKMISSFEQPSTFHWTDVDVRFRDAENVIARQDNFSDEIAEREREDAKANGAVFEKLFADQRPAFDRLYETGADRPPASLSEWIGQAQINEGPFWTFAGKLYAHVAKHAVDETTVRRFVTACPPFHAWVVALHAAQFDRGMRPTNTSPSLKSGRNDTIMSFWLPYCRQMVTADPKQLNCYRQVVSICSLSVVMNSYEDFRATLLSAS